MPVVHQAVIENWHEAASCAAHLCFCGQQSLTGHRWWHYLQAAVLPLYLSEGCNRALKLLQHAS